MMGQMAHLRNYAQIAECEVVAIAEVRPQLAQKVADRYNVPAVYGTAEAMLNDEKLDGIVAVQGFDRHLQILPELYRSGLPVLSEKPLAIDTTIAKELLTALSLAGGKHMVAYHKRCDLASERARERVRQLRKSNEYGSLRYVRVTMPPGDWIRNGFEDLIRTDEQPPAAAPDATPPHELFSFVNYYIHQVNLVRFLLDEDFSVSYVSPGSVVLHGSSASGVDVVIEMAPWTDKTQWHESALVCFEAGWVRLDLPAPLVRNEAGTVTEYAAEDDRGAAHSKREEFAGVHAMMSQAQRFVDVVNGTAVIPSDARDALKDLEIAEQYYDLWNARHGR